MTAFLLVAIGWALVGTGVLATGVRDIRERGDASRVTAALLWPWHALNYALVIVAAAEGLWRIEVSATLAVVVGGVVIVAGAAALAAGFYEFGSEARLTGMRNDELITDGIYRYSRHPQYLGISASLVGVALLGRSGLGLAMAAGLILIFLVYLPFEERFVERTFGERYRHYRDSTPLLLGRPKERR